MPDYPDTVDEREELNDKELHEYYDDMLDEIYGDCKVANYCYSTSRTLQEIDPTAYRCGFSDWLDNEITEGIFIEADGKYYRTN